MVAETILLVENDPDDAILLRHMFRKARVLNPVYLVTTVPSAISYLKGEKEYAERERFPFPILVLLDLNLGGGSGFEILDWLNTNRKSRPAAVVVLTGSDINAVKRSYQRGADSFLIKPLNFEEFKNMVHHIRGVELEESDEGYRLAFK